jgi:mannose-6-phosphate isomerase-like protein (cupin superfamily)
MRANELCPKKKVRPLQGRVTKSGRKNDFLRMVMCTGPGSQLVVMSIPPGQEIGEEIQADIDQTLFIVAGQGEAGWREMSRLFASTMRFLYRRGRVATSGTVGTVA